VIDAAGLISHRFSLDQWKDAFDTFVTRRDHAMQVAIQP
jgi:threonine dehydrogenase-like Zn-dependent dehydrogenase